jgi:hypothetical protein
MLAVVSSQSLRFGTHVEHPTVIAAATEAPRGERPHAVGAHVAEGHWRNSLFQVVAFIFGLQDDASLLM